jgi:CBS domain containing-hemolysin-like protein
MEIVLYIFILLVLTYLSGYFSASEIALFSLPSSKVKAYETDKDYRKKLIAQLLSSPRDLLVTVFIMNTLVNILLQNVASDMFGPDSSWLFKIGVPLFLTFIVGEIIPKYIAMEYNVSLASKVAPTIDFLTKILKPIREFTVTITTPISRILFFFLKKEKNISREELQHVLQTSQKYGVLDSDEAELISGYLEFQSTQVKELMWPKEDVLFYNINEPLSKLVYLFVDQECTRLPVCDQEIDRVIGIIDAQQYFVNRSSIKNPEDLKIHLTKPFFVPETIPTRLLWRQLIQKKETLALIVDEYGSISGLLTQEDLVEEVVGEITDRRDQNPLYTKAGEDVIIASGKLELIEFEEIFGVSLEGSNMLTLGGWLTEQMGDIPKSGAKYETEDFLFQVLSAEPTRVRSIYVRKKNLRRKGKP